MAFVHLHNHSDYSLLDGMCKPKELIAAAKNANMDAIALSDHGVMYGLVPFYLAAKEQGVKPILGCELYLSSISRYDKNKDTPKYNHVILLAQNKIGYHNLMRLCTLGYLEGFYKKPRVDMELLQEYNEGLVCLSACFQGLVPRLLLDGHEDTASLVAEHFATIFKDRFYLELQMHGMDEELKIVPMMIELASAKGIPLIATNDTHYIDPKSAYAKDGLWCVRRGELLDKNKIQCTDQLYFKDEAEMRALGFPPQAYDNTSLVASQCDVELEFDRHWAKWTGEWIHAL